MTWPALLLVRHMLLPFVSTWALLETPSAVRGWEQLWGESGPCASPSRRACVWGGEQPWYDEESGKLLEDLVLAVINVLEDLQDRSGL